MKRQSSEIKHYNTRSAKKKLDGMDFSPSLIFGLCEKAHYHYYRNQNDILLPPLPSAMSASKFDTAYRNAVPINCKFYVIKDCPCDLLSAQPSGTQSSEGQNQLNPMAGTGDQAGLISNAIISALEEKLFNSIQKKQTELLDNFKKETSTIMRDFKDLYRDLSWKIESISTSIAANRSQMQKFTEQVEELECRIQELVPDSPSSDDSDTSSNQSEESEDILQEIEVIKQSDRTFMDYRPLTGQCWEVNSPVTFEVKICDFTLNAIYDPRVAKSIMSDDILFADDETEELEYDKVFYVPWWFPKLQTCRDEGAVDIVINTYHSHNDLKVALNPLWNKTVVLGFNFGQRFIDNVNEDNGTITLSDSNGSSYCLNFEYYNN